MLPGAPAGGRQGSFPPQRLGGIAPGSSRSCPGRLGMDPTASRWAWCPSWSIVLPPCWGLYSRALDQPDLEEGGCQSEFVRQMCSATLLGRVTSMLKFKGHAVGWAEMGLGCADPRSQALPLATRSYSITRANSCVLPSGSHEGRYRQ